MSLKRLFPAAAAVFLAASALAQIPYDHHVHFMSADFLALLKKIGFPLSRPEAQYTDPAEILKTNPAGKAFFISMAYQLAGFGFGEAEYARVQAENDNLAKAAAEHPGRIFGFFSVHPLRDYAMKEVLRCHGELKLHGLKLHFDNSKINLRDPAHAKAVRDLLQIAGERKFPVLIHLDNRTPEFGRPDAQAFLDEILAKVPPLELYIAHLGTGGGFREQTKDVLELFERALKDRPEIWRHDIRFDISGVAFAEPLTRVPVLKEGQGREIGGILRRIGLDRFVFATDYPIVDAVAYLRQLRMTLGLSPEELEKILNNTGPLMRKG
jgi:predicted TIM-barrel fold metal-dependent hydrolase